MALVGCLELIQHLLGGEVEGRVEPLGGEFCHGAQEEVAAGQVSVRHLQARQVDDQVVDCHDVDINESVHIVAVGIAVAVSVVEFVLDVVDDVECLDR